MTVGINSVVIVSTHFSGISPSYFPINQYRTNLILFTLNGCVILELGRFHISLFIIESMYQSEMNIFLTVGENYAYQERGSLTTPSLRTESLVPPIDRPPAYEDVQQGNPPPTSDLNRPPSDVSIMFQWIYLIIPTQLVPWSTLLFNTLMLWSSFASVF